MFPGNDAASEADAIAVAVSSASASSDVPPSLPTSVDDRRMTWEGTRSEISYREDASRDSRSHRHVASHGEELRLCRTKSAVIHDKGQLSW